MAKTMLNVKIDPPLKRAAQKLAKEIGVPLSTVVNAHLKRFLEERHVDLYAVPTYYLKGKAAEDLDKLVEDSLREYHEGKTIKADPLSDAMEKYRKEHAR